MQDEPHQLCFEQTLKSIGSSCPISMHESIT